MAAADTGTTVDRQLPDQPRCIREIVSLRTADVSISANSMTDWFLLFYRLIGSADISVRGRPCQLKLDVYSHVEDPVSASEQSDVHVPVGEFTFGMSMAKSGIDNPGIESYDQREHHPPL